MSAAAIHRGAIVGSAVALFRQQGYAATGLNQILAASGAPKGSLYHYFPAGKAAIGAEAVRTAGATVAATLAALTARARSPGALIAAYCRLLAGWMAQSGYRDGCPIATTLLEMAPEDEAIRRAGEAAFAAWAAVIETSLGKHGIGRRRARRLAWLASAAIEGALVQTRVVRHAGPLRDAAAELKAMFDLAAGGSDSRRPAAAVSQVPTRAAPPLRPPSRRRRPARSGRRT
ncbi:MAG TPA: helix-turn-helix domain-containing protein [Candidatus Sulfotelmatobacter sp.]|nr:helix-turn-helix domain-containing protein [Candidatus Sulfotelmatobacter sp.]